MPDINEYLNKRSEELMMYKMPKNESLMDEIWVYDARNLEATASADISKYAIGLAQYLIYFSSQVSATKVKLMQKRRFVDVYVFKSDINGRTKMEKRLKVIEANPELKQIELDIEALECELAMVEGQEKGIQELINTFKRELTRREAEQKFTRLERRL